MHPRSCHAVLQLDGIGKHARVLARIPLASLLTAHNPVQSKASLGAYCAHPILAAPPIPGDPWLPETALSPPVQSGLLSLLFASLLPVDAQWHGTVICAS